MVIACTFAPATTPLWAIGVAIEIALAQLWPGPPGMFDGYRRVTVGTTQETSPMSSEPPPVGCLPSFFSAIVGLHARRAHLWILVANPRTGCFISVGTPLPTLVVIRPLRQSDLLDVGVHRLSDRLIEVSGPRAAQKTFRVFGVGHQSGGLRHVVADAPQVHDVVVISFAEIKPDGCVRRNHVGLIAAIGNHVVDASRQAKMLPAEIVADTHQFTASRALFPRHGAPAAWALSPLKLYSTETRPFAPLGP